jgi:hypothetical protein
MALSILPKSQVLAYFVACSSVKLELMFAEVLGLEEA